MITKRGNFAGSIAMALTHTHPHPHNTHEGFQSTPTRIRTGRHRTSIHLFFFFSFYLLRLLSCPLYLYQKRTQLDRQTDRQTGQRRVPIKKRMSNSALDVVTVQIHFVQDLYTIAPEILYYTTATETMKDIHMPWINNALYLIHVFAFVPSTYAYRMFYPKIGY
ncbi:hypothetical protein QR685DRAFT_185996 [Neurospora intermedia]|uniref:Uncharacterized protein n=1 Tax=Neurospora intermedia TaxID=5142 RepID=A0ABR3DM97_NEUIN